MAASSPPSAIAAIRFGASRSNGNAGFSGESVDHAGTARIFGHLRPSLGDVTRHLIANHPMSKTVNKLA